jgi:hypothetical protein
MEFIARQPILTRERSVYAYELLFRSGIQNSCEGINLDQASASMFVTSFMIGLHRETPRVHQLPERFSAAEVRFIVSSRSGSGRTSRND